MVPPAPLRTVLRTVGRDEEGKTGHPLIVAAVTDLQQGGDVSMTAGKSGGAIPQTTGAR